MLTFMKQRKRKSGFTLIELIVALSLITMVISVSTNMIIFSMRSHEITINEYELQSAMRMASDSTNRVIRYSSALFTIPSGRFYEANLTEGWSYFGVSDDGREIVRYTYETRGGVTQHWKEVLVPAQDNLTYDFVFEQDSATNDSILKFKIVGTVTGTSTRKIEIDSEIEALNALQVVDRGTALTPATAIAYRSDERPTDQIVGVVSMVMDVSGSMGDTLAGNSASAGNSRLDKLKVSLGNMINEFAKEENMELSLVPFSTTANYRSSSPEDGPTSYSANDTHQFYKVSNSTQRNNMISVINDLYALGGTNTGDGIRRAYYRNLYYRTYVTNAASGYGSGHSTKDYMIILVDGVTTYRSGTSSTSHITTDGYISSSSSIYGSGNSESTQNDAYVTAIGNLVKNAGIKVYVIGYSSVADELLSVNKIATAVGALTKDVYYFTDALDLDQVFTEIKADIMKDLWHVRGPQL